MKNIKIFKVTATALAALFCLGLFSGCVKGQQTPDSSGDVQQSDVYNDPVYDRNEPAIYTLLDFDGDYVKLARDEEFLAACRGYLAHMSYVNYSWSRDVNSPLYTENNAAYFKLTLQELYKYETGRHIEYDREGRIAMGDYLFEALAHFPLNEKQVRDILISPVEGEYYDRESDSLIMAEGFGTVNEARLEGAAGYEDHIVLTYHFGTPEYDRESGEYILKEYKTGYIKLTVENANLMFTENTME